MLQLGIGDSLLLRCAHFEERHLGVLVGKKSGRYLVVYTDLPDETTKRLAHRTPISIRYAHEGTLLGFETRLSDTPVVPGRLLMLEYPESVSNCDLRSERRLVCNFPARLTFGGTELPGLVRDLSASAVRVTFPDTETDPPALLLPDNAEMRLDFFVIEPETAFSFRCRLLREFIAQGRRHAVLVIHEHEGGIRDALRDYVDYVYGGPVAPVCGEQT